MEFSNYFPIWNKLTASQQALIQDSCVLRRATAGSILHNGSLDCLGLLLVQSGQLRAVMLSPEGREITIYRLFEQDICLFSASCVMRSIQFEITIEVEKDTELWIIPPDVYQTVMEESAAVANYTNEIMSSRFSEVMWLMEQVMWKSFDRRLAGFLVQESLLEGAPVLKITHERIANHLGTAREVVTRMLRYFQREGMVRLARGSVELLDEQGLCELAEREKESP